LGENIERNDELLDTQMSARLYQVWVEDLRSFLGASTDMSEAPRFNVSLDDFYLLWHRAMESK